MNAFNASSGSPPPPPPPFLPLPFASFFGFGFSSFLGFPPFFPPAACSSAVDGRDPPPPPADRTVSIMARSPLDLILACFHFFAPTRFSSTRASRSWTSTWRRRRESSSRT